MASTSALRAALPPLPEIAGTDPDRCILDSFRTAIAELVSEAILDIPLEKAYEAIEYGKKGEDFTIALPRFRLKVKVDELAKKIIGYFQPNEWIEKVSADKAFVHFRCNTRTLTKMVLNQVHEMTHLSPTGEPTYGTNMSGLNKKVIIEYSSPNIAKSFHVGHLRSTIIGAFLANLYKACGWEVVSLNYLGDWGTQFGLIAVGFEKYGSEEELQKDAIKHLLDIYIKVNADAEKDPNVKIEAAKFFKRMEDGDETALENWRKWRELSVKKYAEEYDRLNVRFDEYIGESMVSKTWQDYAIDRLEQLGLIEDHDGAKLVNLEDYKLARAVLRKRDGTSIYLTRDIGGVVERWEKYHFDKAIYVISSQQDLHMQQFMKIISLMEYHWADRIEHINYGLVLGMSTRRGTVVFLDEIIKEATSVMHEHMQKNEEKYKAIENPEYVAREVGISGIKIQDMAAKRINNYTFNWDRMLSFEGDTGPYLQYAHVRLASMERKNPELLPLPPAEDIKTELIVEPAARDIIFLLGTYPDVVKNAMKTSEPSTIVTFAFRLAHAISSAWETVIVKGEQDREKAQARLFLYICARDVLASAMRLLTLVPLERM